MQVALHQVLEPVLHVGHPIGKNPAGEHGAKHPPGRINLVLLQPAEIKHRVVRHPCALHGEELLNLNPVVVVQRKTVEHHRLFAWSAQLQ